MTNTIGTVQSLLLTVTTQIIYTMIRYVISNRWSDAYGWYLILMYERTVVATDEDEHLLVRLCLGCHDDDGEQCWRIHIIDIAVADA
jgi:hypothetical protein